MLTGSMVFNYVTNYIKSGKLFINIGIFFHILSKLLGDRIGLILFSYNCLHANK